jgi:hypothetical protein
MFKCVLCFYMWNIACLVLVQVETVPSDGVDAVGIRFCNFIGARSVYSAVVLVNLSSTSMVN